MPTILRVLDGSNAGIGDTIAVQSPSVGLTDMALKVAARKWSFSEYGEDWVLQLPTVTETVADELIAINRKVDLIAKITQQIDKREVEE